MECYICGKNIGDNLGLCPECKAKRAENNFSPPPPQSSDVSYEEQASHRSSSGLDQEPANFVMGQLPAGLRLRTLAYLIDGLILSLMTTITSSLILKRLFNINLDFSQLLPTIFSTPNFSSASPSLLILNQILIGQVLAVLLSWLVMVFLGGILYFALFEASELRATPGKLLVGIAVVKNNGEKMSLLQSLGRAILRVVSFMVFLIGILMIPFSSNRLALHDIITGTRVIKSESYSVLKVLIALIVFVALLILSILVEPKTHKTKGKSIEYQKEFYQLR